MFLGKNTITNILLGVFILVILITILASWLEYTSYEFLLDTDALRIKRGVVSKEEIAIPYRQIQNVDIERSMFFQVTGVSKLIILTAGHSDTGENSAEAEGVIPIIDKGLAERLQSVLLSKTNIQKITNVGPQV